MHKVYCCFKFQEIYNLSLSLSKRRANFPKSALCMFNLCVYLICILHLIEIRTFLKKIDSYLGNHKFARRFEGLKVN